MSLSLSLSDSTVCSSLKVSSTASITWTPSLSPSQSSIQLTLSTRCFIVASNFLIVVRTSMLLRSLSTLLYPRENMYWVKDMQSLAFFLLHVMQINAYRTGLIIFVMISKSLKLILQTPKSLLASLSYFLTGILVNLSFSLINFW